MKNIFLLILIFLSLYFAKTAAQQKNFIAKVGDTEISAEEFRLRFELMPIVSENRNPDSLRSEFLYTLIAEKLIAHEAEQSGFAGQQRFRDLYEPLEKMFIRDALFKEEVESKVKITDTELKKGIERFPFLLKVKIMSSADENFIRSMFASLQQGASFDSLLMVHKEFAGSTEQLEIKYGQMQDEFVEDTLFNLTPGNFSAPVQTESGWFIFYLVDKIYSSEVSDLQKISSEVKKNIRERKTKEIGMNYLQSLFENFTAEPDEQIFYRLVSIITETLSVKDTIKNKKENEFVYLSPSDIDLIK